MAEDRPPRRRTATKPPPSTATPKPTPEAAPGKGSPMLQKKLERMIVGCALPFKAVGDDHCADVFVKRGPVVAEAWANLAAESPAVKEVLEGMLKGGAWAGAIGATVALVIPVAAHHGAPIPVPIRIMYASDTPVPTPAARERRNGSTPPPPPFRTTRMEPEETNNGTPGPAAFSVNEPSDVDATDPSIYAGSTDPDSN